MVRKFVNTNSAPVVETKEGKLRGFILDGIYTFHGVKYAEAERFQAPKPIEPWDGIKNATNYGYICPVDDSPAPSGEVFIPHRFWPSNEHCQNLNIWTPGIGDKKRPVVVWLHGGGFANGSAIEQVAYEGGNLAKYGDVVVVSINHRLNILGYLDMSSYGEKYANSVNAGMADIVAALQWIHDNIETFGGDPDNVTVFGQSGGGGKVQCLLQIPAAAGLFHKAVMMSGILPQRDEVPVDYRTIVDGMLKELKIAPENVEELETVPYYFLNAAFQKVCSELDIKFNWNPQSNDWYIGDPMKHGFSDYAKTVPSIAGSAIAEFGIGKVEKVNALTDDEIIELLRSQYGESTDSIIASFRSTYPDKRLALLEEIDTSFRSANLAFMEKKAAESVVPNYLYNFTLEFPVLGGAFAWHCSDIPFVFHNTELVGNCNIEGVTEALEGQMAGALVSFAYTGNPNHMGMPKWRPIGEHKETMIFDRESKCCDDYDTELITKLNSAGKAAYAPRIAQSEKKAKKEWIY